MSAISRHRILLFPVAFLSLLVAVAAVPGHRSGETRDAIQEASETATGPNLIANASAESLSPDPPHLPEHWQTRTWSGQPVFEVEEAFARSGNRCLKIHSKEGADASWSFPVTVRRNRNYRLSAWVRTENITGGGLGALLNLHELQMEGKADALRGTQDWQPVVTEFNSGNRESLLVNLLFGGWGRSTGTVWFDDVELVELKSRPQPVLSEDEALVLFETRVLPILQEQCFDCHGGGDKVRGELILTNREDLLAGGESGPAIDTEFPEDSLLLEAINYDSYEMPPDGQLPEEDIQAITQWVMAGAPWKGEGFRPDVDHDRDGGAPQVNQQTRQWWSYQPVQRPAVPQMETDWATSEIDRFILRGLQARGLQPAPRADRRTLIRRVYYDLTGLPPTPQEVAEFVADNSPQAWESLVERLLASPHYGEKWGRHWLDVVRYAESNSYERDGTKPYVWRYRDYVIRSFNEDKPYDLFLMEQLAGDEMDEVTPERIIATGYYRLGLWDDEPADPKQAWYDDLDDVLATTAQGMLGMTINCARCHDHKIDPVPQEDYYRMLAFFRNVRRYGVRAHQTVVDASVRVIAPPEVQEKYRAEMQEYRDRVRQNREAMEAIEEIASKDFIPVEHEDFKSEMNRVSLVAKRAGGVITREQADRYKELFEEMQQLRNAKPRALASALCVKETGSEPLATHVLVRGNAHVEGPEVQPGFPSVLSPPEPEITGPAEGRSTGRRMALARWITDPANPLTARVMVNRIWQHHFGRGIVRSSSDFGFQGSLPTHPGLLDWLASEFVERDWSIKAMHRLILTSAAYQMSSRFDAAAYEADPNNDAFWRFDIRRLTAEEIRDSILAVNGTLNRDKMYGPSIYPVIPDEVLQGQSVPGANWGTSAPEDVTRRSVYIHIKRSLPVPLLASFDASDPDSPCPVRFNTVQPTQALGMINSDFIKRQAAAFASLVAAEVPDDSAGQVSMALQRVMQRAPTNAEIQRGVDFIRHAETDDDIDRKEALRQFCLIALNLNEFLFLD
jgi:mono/diheme cytochrome c family protein